VIRQAKARVYPERKGRDCVMKGEKEEERRARVEEIEEEQSRRQKGQISN